MRPLRDSMAGGIDSTVRSKDGKFNAKEVAFSDGTKAILKERLHSNETFRGVPKNHMHIREVLFYQMDKLLGFDVVPETIWVRTDRPASLQRFVHGRLAKSYVPGVFDRSLPGWEDRVTRLANYMHADDCRKIVVLDLLLNNADRHAKNFLISPTKRVWAIDNGLSAGPNLRYYRSVIHKYLFSDRFRLPHQIRKKLEALDFETLKERMAVFGIDPMMIFRRAQFILKKHAQRELSFRRLSRGNYGKNDFPSYRRELMPEPEKLFPFIVEGPDIPSLSKI